jgi:nitroreductase
MKTPLPDSALDLLFREARSYNRWTNDPVPVETLHALYEGKARLLSCVSPGNVVKVEQAPVTVIVGMDTAFAERLPELFPAYPAAKDFFKDPVATQVPMLRNGSLQGAYLIIAARALGLDCGPMSGFDNGKLDAEFFAGTTIKSNFICALGTGTTEYLFPRNPRLSFAEACKIV